MKLITPVILVLLTLLLAGFIHGVGSGGGGGCVAGQFDFSCNVAITAAVMP